MMSFIESFRSSCQPYPRANILNAVNMALMSLAAGAATVGKLSWSTVMAVASSSECLRACRPSILPRSS